MTAAGPRPPTQLAVAVAVALALAGCGTSGAPAGGAPAAGSAGSTSTTGVPAAHPQAVEPTAGEQSAGVDAATPVGDVDARAPSLATVKSELRLELIAARVTSARYINPLQYVSRWERTDQGVDASMPVGAPILAPSRIKVLAIIRDWYAGQPLLYFELLGGPDAGKVQYVAEQITDIAPAGSFLSQGQTIARFARSGTGIEYGWSTLNGVTLARATTGYEEGQVTPAGRSIRVWLNRLGANAGDS